MSKSLLIGKMKEGILCRGNVMSTDMAIKCSETCRSWLGFILPSHHQPNKIEEFVFIGRDSIGLFKQAVKS